MVQRMVSGHLIAGRLIAGQLKADNNRWTIINRVDA